MDSAFVSAKRPNNGAHVYVYTYEFATPGELLSENLKERNKILTAKRASDGEPWWSCRLMLWCRLKQDCVPAALVRWIFFAFGGLWGSTAFCVLAFHLPWVHGHTLCHSNQSPSSPGKFQGSDVVQKNAGLTANNAPMSQDPFVRTPRARPYMGWPFTWLASHEQPDSTWKKSKKPRKPWCSDFFHTSFSLRLCSILFKVDATGGKFDAHSYTLRRKKTIAIFHTVSVKDHQCQSVSFSLSLILITTWDYLIRHYHNN